MAPHIIVVDDDPNLLRLVVISLEKAGFQVTSCRAAKEVLDVLKTTAADLLISDIMMPEMDGIQLCKQIRENRNIAVLPIIFMTNSKDPDLVVSGFRAGADNYIPKPPERQKLLSLIAELLERSRSLKEIDKETSNENIAFSGNLSELTLVEIIQLISMNHRSGVLEIEDGTISFVDGNMFQASYNGVRNELAINELVTLKQGTFRFINGSKDIPCDFEGNTMHVLMEACRLMDEKTS